MNLSEYAMYKGESFLYIGTMSELAELHGVKRDTIHFYTTQAYRNKIAKRKNARNYITVDRLDGDYE